MKSALLGIGAALCVLTPAAAQPSPGPQPYPPPPMIPAPQDIAYPGVLRLEVDATDLDHRIFAVRETIPVEKAGRLTLLYPNWLPGKHAPRGAIADMAGFSFKADGKPVPWVRDPIDVFAFHIDVPAGATSVEAQFQFLSATMPDQGRIVVTPEMMSLQWQSLVLYPAGHFARRIQVEPSVRLPSSWTPATALETVGTGPDGVHRFKPVDLETLQDSPMVAGRYAKAFDLDPGGPARVTLNVFADRPEQLDASADQVERHRELVRQAYRLFGAHHYDHYDFLFSLSDKLGGIGVEHQRSSEDGTSSGYFENWATDPTSRDLLAHEFTHSWNGKFRRPADLWIPNFNVPMRGSLLWVYEGQTQYWGFVLGARSGLLSGADAMEALAYSAAIYDNRVGREWRSIEDTTLDPVIAARNPIPWPSWQRSEDYYSEGQLVWLDADTLIRQRSGGKRSLDDFARAFFGMQNGSWTSITYTFDDVVAALNGVEPYDWADFLNARINAVAPKAPLDGLARSGWKLVYGETPTDYFKAVEARRKATDLTYSLGLVIGRDGDLLSVQWNGPAFRAGLALGSKVVAVNGLAFDPADLKDAITAAKTDKEPISLLIKTGDRYRTVPIDYHSGLRYPRLERIAGAPDLLAAIYAKRK